MDAPAQVKALFDQGIIRNIRSPKTGDVIRLDRFLGRGAFGAVFKGLYEKFNLEVAIKIFILQNQKSLALFSEESAAYVELSASPLCSENIVCMIDAFINKINYQGKDISFGAVISEFMNGGDLSKGLPDEEIPLFLYSMLNAVDFLHTKGFAHRDIKPPNILRSNTPNVSPTFRLGDLGLACSTHYPGVIEKCNYAGTMYYLSPEANSAFINKNNHLTTMHQQQADDIWQLGITFVELIFKGFPPIPGGWSPENIAKLDQRTLSEHIYRNRAYPRVESPVLSGTVIMNMLSSMLRVDPEERSPARFLFRYVRQNIKAFDINFTNLAIFNYFTKQEIRYLPEITPDFERKIFQVASYFKTTKVYDPYYFLDKYIEMRNEYTMNESQLTEQQRNSYKLMARVIKTFIPVSEKTQY